MKFDTAINKPSIIKVIGVGGGGSNAVNHMFEEGIKDVDFIICNTDAQALEMSNVPVKIQLGARITEGRGAGSIPAVGKECAMDNIDEIRSLLQHNTKMLFITAGMGGGTGTGAAPVIASVAKELGILTVAIVTKPFLFEGKKRMQQAEEGIEELRKYVDTLLIICNEKLRELYGNQKLGNTFKKADNILTTAAKGIAEIITVPGYVNVDFEDVKTVMKNSGVAIMGAGAAEGENRAKESVEMALTSPLLNDNQIKGAQNILLYIVSGTDEVTMDEVSDITDYIQREAGSSAEIIWGNGFDEKLENKISVTIIATGFNPFSEIDSENINEYKQNKIKENILNIEPDKKEEFNNNKNQQDLTDIQIIEKTSVVKENIPLSQNYNKQLEINIPQNMNSTNENLLYNNDKNDNDKIQLRSGSPVAINNTSNEKIKIIPENEIDTNIDELKKIQDKKIIERNKRLQELSVKTKTIEGLEELENIPAYIRRDIRFIEQISSEDTSVSNFSISTNNKGEINNDNSFLNKKVD